MTHSNAGRMSGTVKFFNREKGYGFIIPDGGGKDVFVHISAVQRSGLPVLEDGQRVSFNTKPDERGKGPKAIDLELELVGAPANDDQPAEALAKKPKGKAKAKAA